LFFGVKGLLVSKLMLLYVMDWETVGFLLLLNGLGAVFLAIFRKKMLALLGNAVLDSVISWALAEKNEDRDLLVNAVTENAVTKVKMALLGQKGGLAKGINVQMKGLETDLIKEGLDGALGFSGISELAMPYLEKYPILKTFLPMVMGQLKVGNVQQTIVPGQVPEAT
jgi:hypothetical protein